LFKEKIAVLKKELEERIKKYEDTSKGLDEDGFPRTIVGLNIKGDRVYLQYSDEGKQVQKPLGKKRYVGFRKLRAKIADHNKLIISESRLGNVIAKHLSRIRKLEGLSNAYDSIENRRRLMRRE